MLKSTDPTLRAEYYAKVGLEGLYLPAEKLLKIDARPVGVRFVSEGRIGPYPYALTTTLDLR